MRRWMCVPMMTLCLLLTGCGAEQTEQTDPLALYREMTGCSMVAVVTCEQAGLEWEGTLKCEYVPNGESFVEVLAPESIAGVRAVFDDTDWRLEYEDVTLNAGALSDEEISPAVCLPRLMYAAREGWLLEQNEETWEDIPCTRVTLDQNGGRLLSTLWLRQEGGTPLRGELSVDGEIILTAEFTNFVFYGTINSQE